MKRSQPALTVISGNTGYSSLNRQNHNPDIANSAETVAHQMKYFSLVARKCSYSEVPLSAERAGFALASEDPKNRELRFRWKLGEPDIVFSLSFKDSERVWIVAETGGDIFGLLLVGHSLSQSISVGTKPWLGNDELGSGALKFREALLAFPDFVESPAWSMFDA